MLFGTFIHILTSLIRDFCTSDRNFASTFFQIPPHDGHPWSWLVVGHCDYNPHNRLSLSRYMPCPAYQNVDFEKNIILYYQSLLQNNVYEDIPLIQNFILDYFTETNNKDMMIKILIDIKSFNDKDLTLKSSTLFTTSQS